MPVQCPLYARELQDVPLPFSRDKQDPGRTSEGKTQPECLEGSILGFKDGLSPLVPMPGATTQP